MDQARIDRAAMRSDCKDLGEGRPCRQTVAAETRSALAECQKAAKACRTCCGDGRGVTECLAGCEGTPADSTWIAVQRLFERRGCTAEACHGAGKSGGLDLTAKDAYENLVEAPSTASGLPRVVPGDGYRSYLFLKLAARTDPSFIPSGVEVGTPMPNGDLPPLTADELEAVRRWIYGGAPKTGTVPDTAELLDACLPPERPLRISPLAAPKADEGIQFKMPPFRLEATSEHEYCFGQYYDFTGKIPAEYLTPDGKAFYFDSQELRMDPQSHHLILYLYPGPVDSLQSDAFGEWTCVGGKKTGQSCEPTDLDGCGPAGACISAIRESFACAGVGGVGRNIPIGGAQKAQNFDEYPAGVYAQLPVKGVILWNPHAFNLSPRDTAMNGRLNYYFAGDRRWFIRSIFSDGRNLTNIFKPSGIPAYAKGEVCNQLTLPENAHLIELSSHTHRHGEYFWIRHADGRLLYENRIYNDPPTSRFDPPLVMTGSDADRTITYCAIFNNGVKADGTLDPELVTRASRVPLNAPAFSRCVPTHCAAGRIGAACGGVNDDRTCDSSPGANDGDCDACPIRGGESTENEMFLALGSYYVP